MRQTLNDIELKVFACSPLTMGSNIFARRNVSMTRRIAGKKAQSSGARWENMFFSSAFRAGLHPIRIENGCKTAQGRLIRVRQPFDWILSCEGLRAAFIDTKTCKSKRFSFSGKVDHQVDQLSLLEKHGHVAGYLVLFSTSGAVVFFKASQLKNMLSRTSLTPEDGQHIGREMDFDLKRIFE